MVQGLGFLSKKSWHTKNIANQEKVWIAEAREKDEQAKTAELAKQIQQEREDDELSKIAGRKQLDRGIDWMYTGHHKDSETAKEDAAKQAEEYLLGKEFAPSSSLGRAHVAGDLNAAADLHEGVNAVVAAVIDKDGNDDNDRKPAASAASYYQEDSVAQRNEAFRMRHEDPMFAVSLQAVRKEKSLEQRKDLYERAGFSVGKAEDGSSFINGEKREERNIKKSRKRKKEHKKKLKKSQKRYDSDSDDSGDDDISFGDKRHRRRTKQNRSRRSASRQRSDDDDDDDSLDRSRCSSKDNRHHRKNSHRYREDRSYRKNNVRSRQKSRSRDDSDDDDSLDSSDRRHHFAQQHSGDRRRRKSPPRDHNHHRSGSGSWSRNNHHHNNEDNKRKPPPPRLPSDDDDDDHQYNKRPPHGSVNKKDSHCTVERKESGRYGLLGGEKSNRNGPAVVDLGPDRELLQRKRVERDAERFRIRESTSNRRHKTPAEREAALSAMERDAACHAAVRDRVATATTSVEHDDSSRRQQQRGASSFLHEMTQRAHGIHPTDEHVSMSKRLQQNRNKNQRAHDDSFL